MDILLFITGLIDYRYRKIPDILALMLGIYAVFFSSAAPISRAEGFIVTAVPLFIIAVSTGKLKGGDVKYLTACAAAMGLIPFTWSLVFATGIAIIWSLITRETSVPLAFVFMLGYALYDTFIF